MDPTRIEKPKPFKLHKNKWEPILGEQDPIWQIYADPLRDFNMNVTIGVDLAGDPNSVYDAIMEWTRLVNDQANIDAINNLKDLKNFMGMVGYDEER